MGGILKKHKARIQRMLCKANINDKEHIFHPSKLCPRCLRKKFGIKAVETNKCNWAGRSSSLQAKNQYIKQKRNILTEMHVHCIWEIQKKIPRSNTPLILLKLYNRPSNLNQKFLQFNFATPVKLRDADEIPRFNRIYF